MVFESAFNRRFSGKVEGAVSPESGKVAAESAQPRTPESVTTGDAILLDKLKSLLGPTFDITKINPSSIELIKRLPAIKQKECFETFYSLISSHSYNNSYIDLLAKLPTNSKIFILEKLAWTNGLRSGSSFDIRIALKNRLIPNIEDQRKWLKSLITSSRANSLDDKEKNGLRADIEKYFPVSEIISGFGYKRNVIFESFKYHAQSERTKYADDYSGVGNTPEETVARFFLNRMLDMGKKYNSLVEKGIISQDKLNVIWQFSSHTEGHIMGIIDGLSILDDEQQKKLNSLGVADIKRFLQMIVRDQKIESTSQEFISGYNVEARPSHEIATLLDGQLISKTLLDNWSEKIIEMGDIAAKHSESHSQAADICHQAKDEVSRTYFDHIHDDCHHGEEEDYEPAHDTQTNEFISFLTGIGVSKISFDALSEKEKNTLFDSFWKTLSQQEQKASLKEHVSEIVTNIAIQHSLEDVSPNTDSPVALVATRQLATKNFLLDLADKEPLLFEQKQSFFKQIENDFDKASVQWYASAQKYGYTEQLRKAWGNDYYKQVEKRFAAQENYMLDNSYDFAFSRQIEQIDSSLENNADLIEYLKDNKIDRRKLQGSLSESEYIRLLSGFLKEGGKSSPSLQERKLLSITNNQMKKYFVKRVTYFLSTILDIDLDEKQGENIANSLSLDNILENNLVTLKGSYQGKKLLFTYNIQTGELFSEDWLAGEKDSSLVRVGKTMKKISHVSGPTFDEYFTQIKDVDYSHVLEESHGDKKTFKEGLKEQFALHCPVLQQNESFREEMEKISLKNILAQEVFQLMGARSDIQDDTHLFALLAKTFDTYTIAQLTKFRGVISYLSLFEKNRSINQKLLLLEHNVDHEHCDVSLDLFSITSLLFDAKQKAAVKGSFADKPFSAFFSSFLEDASDGREPIIDVEKLLTFQEDLSGVEVTSYNKDYNIRALQSNMESSLASSELEQELQNLT